MTTRTPVTAWTFERNEGQKENKIKPEALSAYTATNNFVVDYQAYCKILQVIPHPKLLAQHATDEHGLTGISVRNWRLDTPSVLAMSLAAKNCDKITNLCLFNTAMAKDQLELLFMKLPSMPITTLAIEWNTLEKPESPDEEDPTTIFAGALSDKMTLTALSLRSNGITVEGISAIGKALGQQKKIQSLNLFGNKLGDKGAETLAYYMSSNDSVKQISLSNNGITGKGAFTFVETLTEHAMPEEKMKEIEDAELQIEELLEDAKKKKKKLEREQALVQLGFPMTQMVDNVLHVKPNKTLEFINLSSNAIEDPGLSAINELLMSNQESLAGHFKSLKLQRIKATAEGIAEMQLCSFIDL